LEGDLLTREITMLMQDFREQVLILLAFISVLIQPTLLILLSLSILTNYADSHDPLPVQASLRGGDADDYLQR
jgi:hypothetical protein